MQQQNFPALANTTEEKVFGEEDRSGLPGEKWLGGFYLAEGSYGTVHYWLKVDHNQRVLDRMVIKDLYCPDSTEEPPAYRGIYEDLVSKGLDFGVAQSGQPGKATVDERFFKEAYLQGLMTNRAGLHSSSATAVPLRGFKKGQHSSPARGTHWRIYMDLLHAGDLSNLIKEHMADEEIGKKETPIPEAYIWWVFTCLAKALIEMESRVRLRPGARQEQDEVMAFIDMKPLNMLLNHKRGPEYPVYPKPLFSDFGSAHITYKSDPQNTEEGHRKGFTHVATPGFYPPEMFKKDPVFGGYDRARNEPLDSWTNVWQAGRVIECMMRLKTSLNHEYGSIVCREDSFIKDNDQGGFPNPNLRYSDDLIDLVWQCQRFEPNQRPTPTELLKLIEERASKHNLGMDTWGNAVWIGTRLPNPGRPSTAGVPSESVIAREKAGKLAFLDEYPKFLATLYRSLDVDLPNKADLAFYGNKDFARLNEQVVIPKKKSPMDGFPW